MMRFLEPAEWHIHLGAHKTATTHLQDSLALNQDRLRSHGIGYIERERFRQMGMSVFQSRYPNRFLRKHLPEVQQKRVLLSEELLLGFAPAMLEPNYYPAAEMRVRNLSRLGRGRKLKLFLSIRAPQTSLPSCYAQALRAHAYPPGGFERIRTQCQDRPPSWADLAERILRAAPRIDLTVWTFERYINDPEAILSVFAQAKDMTFTLAGQSSEVKSPSAEAIYLAETTLAEVTGTERLKRSADIYSAHSPMDAPRFRPFTPEEENRLAETYRSDLDRLSRMSRVRLFA